jgi:hypothetical protein
MARTDTSRAVEDSRSIATEQLISLPQQNAFFQIAVWTFSPFHATSRGSPTLTDRSRRIRCHSSSQVKSRADVDWFADLIPPVSHVVSQRYTGHEWEMTAASVGALTEGNARVSGSLNWRSGRVDPLSRPANNSVRRSPLQSFISIPSPWCATCIYEHEQSPGGTQSTVIRNRHIQSVFPSHQRD